MYIIFGTDGSIKESQLSDYINKGSDGVNFIDVVILDSGTGVSLSPDLYTASGSFLLPDKTTSLTATAVLNNAVTTSIGVFEGYRFYFYEAFTQYAGDLRFSLVATLKAGGTLVTYAQTFSVNDSAIYKNTTITWEEYENLMRTLADYQLQYSTTNVRGYPQYESARDDLAKLATDQYVIYQTGSDAATLCEVSSSKGLTPLALDNAASRKYYVYTSKAASTAGVVQSVGTGLCVYYADTDGNKVNYGTNPSEFYAYVLDGNSNYDGTISLGAKNYKFAYDSAVDVFFSDGNTTKIVSPMGNASVELTNADVKAYGTNVYIGSRGDESGSANSGKVKIGNSVLITGGGAVIKLSPADSVTFGGGRLKVETLATFSVSPYCAKDPAGDEYLVNKAYVDKTAEEQATEKANAEQSRAQEKETDLQSQINAINASQNFVATYAKKADMPTPPVSGLEEKDCVLVLKDEDHQDQAYVYKYNSAGWAEVGPLGDYYTKAYINAEFAKTNGNVAYYRSQADSYAKKVDDYANATDDKIAELGKVVDTAKDAYLASTPTFVETSSSTEESDVTPTLVGLFAETGSSTTISE